MKEKGEVLTDKEPYHLIVNTKIDKSIPNLKDFTVKFDKQNLIYTLKKIKSEGNKIYIVNSKFGARTIGVHFQKGTETQYIHTG